jgi:hypothetical protein
MRMTKYILRKSASKDVKWIDDFGSPTADTRWEDTKVYPKEISKYRCDMD